MKFLLPIILILMGLISNAQTLDNTKEPLKKTDVLLQGYYWNCTPGGVWWDSLREKAPEIASAMFSGIILPSPSKGASGKFSMGYDIYDHYDLGEHYLLGNTETRFGSKEELLNLTKSLNNLKLDIYSNIILGYVTGGEEYQKYECTPKGFPDSSLLVFNYPNGSGRFKKDATFFYPNIGYCKADLFSRRISKIGDHKPEWFAFNRLFVQDSLIEYGNFLQSELNLTGFRLFETNYLDEKFLERWLNYYTKKNIKSILDFTGDRSSLNLFLANNQLINNSNVLILDYELRNALLNLCNDKKGGYDISKLDDVGLVNRGISPDKVLHLVESTEFDKTDYENLSNESNNNILRNKKYAYAYVLFSEGVPSIFYRDYFYSDLRDYINKLILARAKYINGKTYNRFDINAFFIRDDKKQNQTLLSKDIYILHRSEKQDGSGAYLVINDSPTNAFIILTDTELPVGLKLKNITGGKAFAEVIKRPADSFKNKIRFEIPPASATVFVTDAYVQLNNPPIIEKTDNIITYTDSEFKYKVNFKDANNDFVKIELEKAPIWLSIDSTGLLKGTPGFFDIGTSEVVIRVKDEWGFSDADTFKVIIKRNTSPVIGKIQDKSCLVGERLNFAVKAYDTEGDSLFFYLKNAPNWLSMGENSGVISGTPSIRDTGTYKITVIVKDNRNAQDSTQFYLKVRLDVNSPIYTYAKPKIDGVVEATDNDWRDDYLLFSDDEEDGLENGKPSYDNDIYTLYATWDSDSLYIGAEYILENDKTFVIYFDAGINEGISNFNSTKGYLGDYPFNISFPDSLNIDYFIIQNNSENYNIFECVDNKTVSIKSKINGIVKKQNNSAEFAISWDDIYGLGAGIIPPNSELNFFAAIFGKRNSNPIDLAPNNINCELEEGTNYITDLIKITPDLNGDGIADPTVMVYAKKFAPLNSGSDALKLYQNYPNPFNSTTTIYVEVKYPSRVQLKVYDVLGREVKQIIDQYLSAGNYQFEFNASDLPSGTYFYRLKGNGFADVKKMILIK